MAPGWVPEAGDIVWLQFHPQAGHEQAGHRPALVLSPAPYGGRTGMVVCCPTTTRVKAYPFEVALPGQPRSVVLADRKGRVSPAVLAEVRAKLAALIGIEAG